MKAKQTHFEEVKEALNRLFSDTTVSKEETREYLIDLKDEIDVMLDSLQ